MALEINQLFSHQRIGDTKTAVLMAVYFPLGLIIAILRFFIAIHVFIISCILPKHLPLRSSLFRVFYTIMGFVVYPTKMENRDKNVKVIVANHVSILDHVIVGLLFPSVVPNVWSLPAFLNWALGYTDMGAAQGRQAFLETVGRHCREKTSPVLAFPEGAMTSGRTGMLKYSTWAFALDQDVQPILITAHRPVINIRVEAMGSSLWQDLLWFLFVPITIFKVRVLPRIEKSDFENAEEFSRGVQQIMATVMGVEATSYTSADKAEYVKRLHTDLNEAANQRRATQQQTGHASSQNIPASASASATPSLDRKVKQVLEVLPHVPENIIRKDLETTDSVDATIFNILENNTAIPVPEQNTPSTSWDGESATPQSTPHSISQSTPRNAFCMTSQGSSPSSQSPSPASTKFAAQRFASSSAERQKSLQERKAALLATARRRFRETSDQDK